MCDPIKSEVPDWTHMNREHLKFMGLFDDAEAFRDAERLTLLNLFKAMDDEGRRELLRTAKELARPKPLRPFPSLR